MPPTVRETQSTDFLRENGEWVWESKMEGRGDFTVRGVQFALHFTVEPSIVPQAKPYPELRREADERRAAVRIVVRMENKKDGDRASGEPYRQADIA